MKKFDVVELDIDYFENNLKKGDYGIVLKTGAPRSMILFFNDKIIGDYAVANIKNVDLKLCDENIPKSYIQEFEHKGLLNKISLNKNTFEQKRFEEFDQVRLVVDKDKYNDYGVFAGDEGVVVIDYETGGEILVDFVSVDDDMQVHGDCISVDIDDLELVSSEE